MQRHVANFARVVEVFGLRKWTVPLLGHLPVVQTLRQEFFEHGKLSMLDEVTAEGLYHSAARGAPV